MTHRQLSNLFCIFFIIVAAFFFYFSFSIHADAIYPRVLCIVLALLACTSVVETIYDKKKEAQKHYELNESEMTTEERAEKMAEEAQEPVHWQDIIVVILVSFVSLLLWKPISFLFAGFLGMIALQLYKKQPIIRSVLISFFTILIMQLVFKNIFVIPIPSPNWWPYF